MENNQQRYIFRGTIAGLLSVHIFKLTKEGQTVFQSDCFQSKSPRRSTASPELNIIRHFHFHESVRDVTIPLWFYFSFS